MSGLAVDNDFNVYVWNNINTPGLQKWSSDGKEVVEILPKEISRLDRLFFHFSTQSLYFCGKWNGTEGVFKLINGSSTPIRINTDKRVDPYVFTSLGCVGLYVNSAGDLYVLSFNSDGVLKWTINGAPGEKVADSLHFDSAFNWFVSPNNMAVDEPNNIIYLSTGSIVIKYSNNSLFGKTIIKSTDAAPIYPDETAVFFYINSILVDRTGYILISEHNKISMWATDGQFKGVILNKYRSVEDNFKRTMSPGLMAFDKLGNLYVHTGDYRIMRFNRTSSTCMNNSP